MKTYQISHEEVVQLNKTLEHTERAVCMATAAVYLLIDSQSFHNMGRDMQVGIHESASELQDRYKELEDLVLQITKKNQAEG